MPGEPVAGLQAELSAEQGMFRLGEPMPIRCTLRNVGLEPLQVVKWCRPLQPPRIVVRLGDSATLDLGAAFAEQERRWALWDAAGRRVDSRVVPQSCEHAGELLTLAPDERWSVVEPLNEYYPISSPGDYVVRARYEQFQQTGTEGAPVWTGTVLAAPLAIRIEPAADDRAPE